MVRSYIQHIILFQIEAIYPSPLLVFQYIWSISIGEAILFAFKIRSRKEIIMKRNLFTNIVLIAVVLLLAGLFVLGILFVRDYRQSIAVSNNSDGNVSEDLQEPKNSDDLIIQIDGYGDQGSYGDPLVGRKIVVRDDLEANPNGWYQRDIYEVTSLEELNIDDLNVPFLVEYERDYSQARRSWQPYYAMNVSPEVSRAEIEKFLLDHPEVVSTSVVIRIDSDGNRQECSLKGLDPLAVRHVLYAGEGITFQTCDSSWSTP